MGTLSKPKNFQEAMDYLHHSASGVNSFSLCDVSERKRIIKEHCNSKKVSLEKVSLEKVPLKKQFISNVNKTYTIHPNEAVTATLSRGFFFEINQIQFSTNNFPIPYNSFALKITYTEKWVQKYIELPYNERGDNNCFTFNPPLLIDSAFYTISVFDEETPDPNNKFYKIGVQGSKGIYI